MKNDRKNVENRQMRILSFVRERGEATVEELSLLCEVSPMTIRRDLTELSSKALIKRVYGRAVFVGKEERGFESDPLIMHCRDRISAYAASLAGNKDEIFINGSLTALNMLDYTDGKELTVRTNNGVVLERRYPSNIRVFVVGGEVYDKIMVGEYVVSNLLTMSADKTFLGCAAVYEDGEFRYDIPTEISINEMMISRTLGEIYILADHSKLKKRSGSFNSYGSFRYNREVTLVTDELADAGILKQLRANEIRVIQVPVDEKFRKTSA